MKKFGDYKIDRNEIITTDRYLQYALKNHDKVSYIKTDSLVYGHPVGWRGRQSPAKWPLGHIPVMITGHSDFHISQSIFDRYNKYCDVWAGVNIEAEGLVPREESKSSLLVKLPLGITNNCDDNRIFAILGDLDSMVEVANESISKTGYLYANINISTYPTERRDVVQILTGMKHVDWGRYETTMEGRKKYLREIRAHRFVVCPRGNGSDTHRLWESLYMGSIPIVRYESTHSGFRDLPILFVNDWNELLQWSTGDYDRIWNEMMSKTWNMDKLNVSYWTNLIDSMIAK